MIWCLGMYASASTWVYNVALKIAQHSDGPPPLGLYVTGAGELAGLAPDRLAVVKTHDVDAAGTALLDSQARAILLSVRDPRDAVASLMLYMHHPFALALQRVEVSARYLARWRTDPRTLLLRYEDGFAERADTVAALAARMGQALPAEAVRAIHAQTTRAAVDAFVGNLAALPTALHDPGTGDVVDTVTQWHSHHAGRTGEVGRWRRLLKPPQVQAIQARMGDWMAAFGYAAAAVPPAPMVRLTVGRYGIIS
jgi:hypothetical protein